MKKRAWIGVAAVAVILGAGAFWGYRAWSSDTYLYALPSHPKALMAVDWPELVRGTGLEAEELSAGCPEGAGIPQGIDWKKRTYAFVSGREFTGFLAAVEDRDELAEWFRKAAKEKLCSEPEEGGGRCWTVWDGSWMVGFDDRALLVMGPGLQADMDAFRREIMSCLLQDKEECGMSSSVFGDVEKAGEACAVAAQLDVLPDLYGEELALGLPGHTNLSDVNIVAELGLEENGLKVEAEIRSENPDVNRYYEQLAVLGGKIEGEYARYVPSDALAWCCVNVNGDRLLEQLRRNPLARTFLMGLNMCVDADLIIKSIRGDMAATFFPAAFSGEVGRGGYLLTARLENTDFLKNVTYWKESAARTGALTFRDFGSDRFFMSAAGLHTYFGVTDKTLYVTPDEGLAAQACVEKTQTLSAWEDEIGGSRFFLWGNLNLVGPMFMAGWPERRNLFRDVVLYSSDARRFTLELKGEEGRNVWKEILR